MGLAPPDHAERVAMPDGVEVALHRWDVRGERPARGVIQIVHGMAEHSLRYGRLADALGKAGFVVYAHDHRGHGATSRSASDLGFFADEGGWERAVDDMYRVNRLIAERHPGLPIVMFGHSMGSMMAQDYLFTHGETLAAAVLSGTGGGQGPMAKVGGLLAKVERARLGSHESSPVLHAAAFGKYNRHFEPVRTEFDWLSADPAEVDKYEADPLCGFRLSTQGWVDMFHGIERIEDLDNQARVPKDLPIYMFSGSLDPVGRNTKGVRWLIDRYRKAGLTHVSHRFYEGGRHEMLNDVAREQVTADLVGFLDETVPEGASGAATAEQ